MYICIHTYIYMYISMYSLIYMYKYTYVCVYVYPFEVRFCNLIQKPPFLGFSYFT